MAVLQVLVAAILVAGCQGKSLVARQRPVHPHDCLQVCPLIFDPVCGSDGVTYGNQCELESTACQQAALFANEADYKPLTMVHQAPCGTVNKKRQFDSGCPMICPAIYGPVCGSNGQTYDNMCHLESAACFAGVNNANADPITLDHYGGCNGEGVFEFPLLLS